MSHESDSWDRQAARVEYFIATTNRSLDRHGELIAEIAAIQIRLEERLVTLQHDVRALTTERALNRYGIPLGSGGLGAALIYAILRLLNEAAT